MREVLLLNAGGGEVLNVIPWTRAVNLVVKERVSALEWWDDEEITSDAFRVAAGIDYMPSVCVLHRYVTLPFDKRMPLKRVNLMMRDGSECQYCGITLNRAISTIDHVLPRSRGGQHVWRNVVLACKRCNNLKADRTPEEAGMNLRSRPVTPTRELLFHRFLSRPGYEVWQPYFPSLRVEN